MHCLVMPVVYWPTKNAVVGALALTAARAVTGARASARTARMVRDFENIGTTPARSGRWRRPGSGPAVVRENQTFEAQTGPMPRATLLASVSALPHTQHTPNLRPKAFASSTLMRSAAVSW